MPPVVIAGGIAAAGAIGGAVLGSHAQSKANSQAAETQNNATNAQLQLGQQSLSQNRDIYNANWGLLDPYVERGNAAGTAINSLLGLGASPTRPSPMATPSTATGTAQNSYAAPIGTAPSAVTPHSYTAAGSDMNYQPNSYGTAARTASVAQPNNLFPTNPAAGAAHPPIAHAPAATSANTALNNFANSAGMQFQMQQGADMINNQYAARGALDSGAAMKAIQNYGQQTALNNYFMPYMGLLGGQQAVGAQAGSAVAGVGSNFGNTAANINGQMGQAINSDAQNIGNLQLANGQNQSNMYGQIGSALGRFGSSFMPTPQY